MAGVLCRARISNAACVRAVLIPACGVGMWLQGSQSAAALEPRAVGRTPQRSGADRLASEPPNTIEEGPLASGLAVGPTGPTGFATAYATSYSCAFEFQPCDLARFSGVSCATGSSCTAVGTAVANTTLAESWAGTKWTIEPTPAPDKSTSSNLASVSCTAATACLAVGSYYSSLGSGWLPLAELWNGSSWTIRPPPTPSEGSNDVLSYVQCATAKACMAVGSYYSSATSQTVPLVEFWDGSAWTIQTVSLPSGASGGQLFGVSCPSMTACTAVGIYYTALGGPSEELALAESWNGTNWSLQPTPNPISNASYSLNAVWCLSAKSCNAVGRIFTGSNEETLAESWDGTTWSIRPTPNPSASTYSYLANLSCDPSGVPCKAVGTSGNETLVESWDGTTWSTQTTPQPANSTRSSFSDVSCTAANACTAVGQYLDSKEGPTGAYRTLAERWDGTNWTAQPTADAALAGTGSATNITSSTAELNGTVYPGGAPTTCYFEYGTTSSYGSTIPCAQSTGPGAASVAVSADLTGLSPNTTYYFTLVATNPGGGMTYTPGPASFTTLATSGGGGGGGSGSGGSGGGGGSGNGGGCTGTPKCPPPRPQGVGCNGCSKFDGATNTFYTTVGGIYARVRNYSPWVDPASPSVAAWVALEKTGNGNELAQMGWREQPHGRRDTLVEYLNTGNFSDCNPQATRAAPGFTNLLACNTVPIPAQPEPYTYYTVLYGYEPGKFTFYINGRKVANAPANFIPNRADVIGETKLVGDQMPGDANDPQVFENINIYVNGAWQSFTPTRYSENTIYNGMNYGGYLALPGPPGRGSCLGIWDTAYGDASAVVRSICNAAAQVSSQAAAISVQATQHVRSSAVVPLSCPSGATACSGTISLEQSPGGGSLARVAARSHRIAKPIAFSLPPGGRERLRLRLTHAALSKLKSVGRLRVRAVIAPNGTRAHASHITSRSFTLLK
jgi:hypothetical protein